jgi:putative phage-type endonuclease
MASEDTTISRHGQFCVAICDRNSGEAEWLAARRKLVGASEVATIIGANPWGSRLALYVSKVSALGKAGEPLPTDPVPESEDNSEAEERMQWGTDLEPVVLKRFIRRRAAAGTLISGELSGTLYQSIHNPRMGATLDGWLWLPDSLQVQWPIEIKTSGAHMEKEWSDGPPPWVMAQVQAQMFVVGAEKITVVCLFGNQRLVWMDVERNEVAISRISDAVDEFWYQVENRIVPDADITAAGQQALKRLYPIEDPGKVIQLPPELQEVATTWQALSDARKATDKTMAELKAIVQSHMGVAEIGVLPSGDGWTWKSVFKREYTVPEQTYRELRFAKRKKG